MKSALYRGRVRHRRTVDVEHRFAYRAYMPYLDLDELNALPRIEIHGLMTIAPYSREPEKARPFFKRMTELKGWETRHGFSA